MAFKGQITRLSELIADKIVGALIQGGLIVGTEIQAALVRAGSVIVDSELQDNNVTGTLSNGTYTTPTISLPTVTGGDFSNPTVADPAITGGSTDGTTHISPTVSDPTITGGSHNDGSFDNNAHTGGTIRGSLIIGSEIETNDPPNARLRLFQDLFNNGSIYIYDDGDDDNHAVQIWSNGGVLNILGPGDKLLQSIPGFNLSGQNPGLVNTHGLIRANDGIKIGFGNLFGETINALDWGFQPAINTNASGEIVISHNLGLTPAAIIWTDSLTNHPWMGRHPPSSDTINNFRITFRRTTDDTLAGSGISVGGSWIAIA